MTPKEQYEARKAERIARRQMHPQQTKPAPSRDDELDEMLDRFVTAIERIADALERGPVQPLDFSKIRFGV
jgi:hypothetical protein